MACLKSYHCQMREEMSTELFNKACSLEFEARKLGFCWSNARQIIEQIKSELIEVEELIEAPLNAARQNLLQEEIGDLLHAVLSLNTFCQFSSENTLQRTLEKFEKRLNKVKEIANDQGLNNLQGLSDEHLMLFWEMAKEKT